MNAGRGVGGETLLIPGDMTSGVELPEPIRNIVFKLICIHNSCIHKYSETCLNWTMNKPESYVKS